MSNGAKKHSIGALTQWLLCSAGYVVLLASSPALANPVPSDDLSLANGSDSYELHCASCHGSKTLEQEEVWYEADKNVEKIDYSQWVDEAEKAREERLQERFRADDSADWAKLQDPGDKANDAEMRAQIMADLVSAIDKEYGDEGAPLDMEFLTGDVDYGLDEDVAFEDFDIDTDRMPGAPDLAAPDAFFYGTDEDELFNIIAKGTTAGMPAQREILGSEDAIWDLVNYIRSLWGADWID